MRIGAHEVTGRPDMVLLTDWLPPDFGAVGQYSLLRAREMAAQGKKVALYGLCSAVDSTEIESPGTGELRITWIKTATYDRASLRQRAWWTLATDLKLVWRSLGDMRRAGEVVFTGSPPFLLHLLGPLNLFMGKRLVYRITDFYPEVLFAESGKPGWLMHLFYGLTKFWRRRVEKFEVLGEDQRRRLEESGIPGERIEIRRDPSPILFSSVTKPLPLPFQGKKILLYSGNFGVAHDHETLVSGYLKHYRSGSGGVALWINAIGSRADLVTEALARAGLPVRRTLPVPLEQLASLLATAAAHVITLREPFWGYVLPSKVYAGIESGKPILFIGPRASDVHLLCSTDKRVPRYSQVEPGDSEGVFRALEEI